LTLKRLLADDVLPEWLFLEVFPPSLAGEGAETTLAKTSLRDFAFLADHPMSWLTYACYARDRFLLWTRYRTGLLESLDRASISRDNRWDTLWNPASGEWRIIGRSISPEQLKAETADARRRYQDKLQDLKIATEADHATRELLELCRQRNIRAVLFVMPEASEFRSWYSTATRKRLEKYLGSICSEYDLPLVDARTWIPDTDFWDGHHLLLHGAQAFMQRFDAEVAATISASSSLRSPALGNR
jgi:hypothetical protein